MGIEGAVKYLIIVPDDHYHKKVNFTFMVYELESGSLIHESPYNPELSCDELTGQGRPTFRPFGIASDEEYIYIASHKKLGKYNKETFEYCGLVDVPMYINTHQILKNEGVFYVTNTSVNGIGIYGKSNKFFDVTSLQCVEEPQQPVHAQILDKCHVNSITEYDGKIYFCLHNLGITPSRFGYFDKYTYESKIIADAGTCCHDVQILNNKLYSLSSGTGEIIEIDLENGESLSYKVADPNKTFLRGMDISDNKIIFVGSNCYSDGVVLMNNCYISTFDTSTKTTSRLFNVNKADIVTCMKIV